MAVLTGALRERGYLVRASPGGPRALAAASADPPDLILVEVRASEPESRELCERLRRHERTRFIPVISISDPESTVDKVGALSCGIVDHLTRPFEFEELEARLRIHLSHSGRLRELAGQVDSLEGTLAERTGELADARQKLASLDRLKGEFLQLISHELRSPLGGILGYTELLFEMCEQDPRVQELRRPFETARRRMMRILDDALFLTEIRVSGVRSRGKPIPLDPALESAAAASAGLAGARGVRISPVPPGHATILADERLLIRALHALLEAAIKLSAAGETIGLSCDPGDTDVRLTVDVRRAPISDNSMSGLFGVFSVAEVIAPGGDLGLSLPLARRIIQEFGGSVEAAAREDSPGIRFVVSLVRRDPDDD
ncbi:MAG: response regulator [Candidatus Riflebacteria bacterium]|nr:response regulator [Candidatus Riflebacteria bacterium]